MRCTEMTTRSALCAVKVGLADRHVLRRGDNVVNFACSEKLDVEDLYVGWGKPTTSFSISLACTGLSLPAMKYLL